MRVTDNGRKSLEELKEMFDKVIIKYYPGTDVDKYGDERDTMKTVVALVAGNTVHVGVSKWSNRGLLYSKTKGRAMAMGRAEIAFNNFRNIESPREAHYEGASRLAYSTTVSGEPTPRNVIGALVAIEKLNEDLDQSSLD